jgi:hypothetical protein
MATVANPWSAEHWNLTAQGQYVNKYGLEVAKKKARDAGSSIGALQPRIAAVGPYTPIPKSNFTVIVQRRGISAPVGGGGLVGAGSSGSGDP